MVKNYILGFLSIFYYNVHALQYQEERALSPDVKYRIDVDTDLPQVVHSFRLPVAKLGDLLKPTLGRDQIFVDDAQSGVAKTLSQIVSNENVLAGVNGDYFTSEYLPVGCMMLNGNLISGPSIKPRSVFVWGNDQCFFSVLNWKSSIVLSNDVKIPVSIYNYTALKNSVTFYTSIMGHTDMPDEKTYGTHLYFKFPDKFCKSSGNFDVKIDRIVYAATSQPIKPGEACVVLVGSVDNHFDNIKVGDSFKLEWKVAGPDSYLSYHALGGGPLLVKDGKEFIDFEAQGFTAKKFPSTRYARTAVGITEDKKYVWLTVADGRSSIEKLNPSGLYSVGATLPEMSKIMLNLGCNDAMNLDGGGSSTFCLLNQVANVPSGLNERPLGNAFLITGKQKTVPMHYKIQGPNVVKIDQLETFSITLDNKPIDCSKVIWLGNSKGWMEMNGRFHPYQAGECVLKAIVNQQVFTHAIRIE